MTNSTYMNDSIATVKTAIEAQKAELTALAENPQALSEKKHNDSVKALKKRIKENETILSMLTFNDTAKLMQLHKIDVAAMMSEKTVNTRELKKRFKYTVTALATRNCEDLKKDDFKIWSGIASGKIKKNEFTALNIQTIFDHETTTQAGYFFNFCEFMKIGKINKNASPRTLTIDSNSSFAKKIIALYS